MIVKNSSRRRAGVQEVRTRSERGYKTVLTENQTEYTTKWVVRLVVLALIIGGAVHAMH